LIGGSAHAGDQPEKFCNDGRNSGRVVCAVAFRQQQGRTGSAVGTIWNAPKDVFRYRHRQLGYFNLQELLDSGAGVVPVSVGDVQRI
jgi:hypothetical protein